MNEQERGQLERESESKARLQGRALLDQANTLVQALWGPSDMRVKIEWEEYYTFAVEELVQQGHFYEGWNVAQVILDFANRFMSTCDDG